MKRVIPISDLLNTVYSYSQKPILCCLELRIQCKTVMDSHKLNVIVNHCKQVFSVSPVPLVCHSRPPEWRGRGHNTASPAECPSKKERKRGLLI